MKRASEDVKRRLAAGWSSAADGLAAVHSWSFRRRESDSEPHHFVDVVAGERHVQVAVSPTGRSVRVFVDGDEVEY